MSPFVAYNTIASNRSLIGNVELESVIASDYIRSYYYALNVLKGRFELGEAAISQSRMYLCRYLMNVPGTNRIELVSILLKTIYRKEYINWYFRSHH